MTSPLPAWLDSLLAMRLTFAAADLLFWLAAAFTAGALFVALRRR